MQIKGTITRAYRGEGLTGSNGRFNGQNVIHVRPEDPKILQELDGEHQVAGGEVRIAVTDELPEVGASVDAEIDETKRTLTVKSVGGKKAKKGGDT